MRRNLQSWITVFLCLCIFLSIGVALELAPYFAPLKKKMQDKALSTEMLNYGAMGRLLKQLGVVRAVPNDLQRVSTESRDGFDLDAYVFPAKRNVGEYKFTSNLGGESSLPSSLVIEEEDFREGWPLISIVADEDDLYGNERGIIANRTRRGQEWERLVYVSYYEDRKLLFSSGAGMRIHGGASRVGKDYSFRLYFRREYGARKFKPGVLFSPITDPLKRLVVRIGSRFPQQQFINDLSFDIGRQIGASTTETKPVMLYLNGELKGIYFLSEHLRKRQWSSHFGHQNFVFYRYRADNLEEDTKAYEELERWVKNRRVRMTMDEAEKRIDIDHFSRHVFTQMYCGNWDRFQGAAVLDRSKVGSKWYWVLWDMEQSFRNVQRKAEIWDRDALSLYLRDDADLHVRMILFSRLYEESPDYRKFFVRLVMDLLNHRLRSDFISSRIEHYKEMAESFGLDDFEFVEVMKAFLTNRTESIREQIRIGFGLSEILRCRVHGADGIKYEIDGYPEEPGYQGWYYSGEPIMIKIVSPHKADFSHWQVGGKRIENSYLIHSMVSNTVIRPVFRWERD